MNPELPQVRPSTETIPNIPGGIEYRPDAPTHSPEMEQHREQLSPSAAEVSAQAPPAVLPQVHVPVSQLGVGSTTGAISDDDLPLFAGDDELIEKEWVDKVKKIITLTKDDPYERSRVIAQLQADYLKKRYNRTIGQADG